jgi:hypothetical protein
MGWGGKRAGAGRKRKSDHAHWLAGTKARDAEPTTSTNVVTLPPVTDPRQDLGDGWVPSRAQRAALGTAGRAYVDDALARFDIARHEGPAVLHIAAQHDAIDRLVLLQKKATLLRESIQLERLILEYQKRIDTLHAKLVEGSLDATESLD